MDMLFLTVFVSMIPLTLSVVVTGPSNEVAEVNTPNVVLTCSTNDGSYNPSWIYYSVNQAGGQGSGCLILVGINDDVIREQSCNGRSIERYFADYSGNNGNLLITSTALIDAGTYVCRDYYNITSSAAVYGVIGSDLQVTSSAPPPMVIQGTPMDFTCRVTYNGSNAMPLALQWSDARNQPINSSTTNSSSLFQSSVTVQAMYADMFPLRCTIVFSPPTYVTVPGIPQSSAAPTYTKQALSANYSVILVPAPTSATATTLSSTEIVVSWTPPQNLSTVASYRLTRSDSSWSAAVPASKTQYTMTDLTPGATYIVHIASCGNDEATYCGDAISATNNTVPAAPGTLKFTDTSTSSLTVYWQQPGYAANYTIYVNYLLTTSYTLTTDNSTVTAHITGVQSPTSTYCLSITAASGHFTSPSTVGCVDPASLGTTSNSDDTTAIIVLSVLFSLFVIATCVLAFFVIRQSALWPMLKCHCKCDCINCVDLVRSQSSHSVSSSAPSAKANDYNTTRTSSQQHQQQYNDSNNYNRRRGVQEDPESSYANVAELPDVDIFPKESTSSGVYESMPDGSVSYTDNVFALSINH